MSSETLPIPGLILLCWPGPEFGPVDQPCSLPPQTSPCFFTPASPGCSLQRIKTRVGTLCWWCQLAHLPALLACSGSPEGPDLEIQAFSSRSQCPLPRMVRRWGLKETPFLLPLLKPPVLRPTAVFSSSLTVCPSEFIDIRLTDSDLNFPSSGDLEGKSGTPRKNGGLWRVPSAWRRAC